MPTKLNNLMMAVVAMIVVTATTQDADAFVQSGYIGSRIVLESPVDGACANVAAGNECYVMPPLSALLKLQFVGAVRDFLGGIAGDIASGFEGSSMAGLMEGAVLVVFPVATGTFTSNYGMRKHPILRTRKMHTGIDFAAARGTPVLAAADGVVSKVGRMGAYGKIVIIDHGNGLTTRYAHLRDYKVKRGQVVKAGDRIGAVGSTGRATGPHLHFEARQNERPVDPVALMSQRALVAAR